MPATSQSLKKLSKIIKKYQRKMEVFRRLDFFSKPIMKTFVIGIGGVTNGGKTTLAKNLQKHLPNCSVISQDDFFKPESEIETDENGFLQYDVLEALNMEKMMSAISCWVENPRLSVEPALLGRLEKVPILIIEGFLLFNYKPLDTIWNRSYFLTIPYEECKRRRRPGTLLSISF